MASPALLILRMVDSLGQALGTAAVLRVSVLGEGTGFAFLAGAVGGAVRGHRLGTIKEMMVIK